MSVYNSDKIKYYTENGTPYSLRNTFSNVEAFKKKIGDCKSVNTLLPTVKVSCLYKNYVWSVFKDTKESTILKCIDGLGNITYLQVDKFFDKKDLDKKSFYDIECVKLTDVSNLNLSLSFCFKDKAEVLKGILSCNNPSDLLKVVKRLNPYKNTHKWEMGRDTKGFTKLKCVDNLGNVRYLVVNKQIIKESFDKVVKPDLSNQPIMLGGVGAGQPVRWTYSHYNNFLNVYGLNNHISMTFNLASPEDVDNKLDYLYTLRDNGVCNNDDIQELEERLRLFCDFIAGGSHKTTKAAIHEGKKRRKGEVYYTTDESGQKVKHVARGSMKVVPESKKEAALNASQYAHTPEADAKRSNTIAARKEVKALEDAISGNE